MAAFDRVCSGISQMDEQFDNIRLGDNVVWRVDKLEDCEINLEEFDTNYDNLKSIIRIYDVKDKDLMLCNDMKKERIICFKS